MKSVFNKSQLDYLVKELAASVIKQHRIDPYGKDLIKFFGLGSETNNWEAINFWVRSSLHQITHQSGALLGILYENFKDELSSFSEFTHQPIFNTKQ